ncbi:hypothetical protein DMUE_6148, partial [Dictyocoela muelleri]
NLEIFEILKEKGVIPNYVYCDCCNNILKIVKYKRSVDGIAYRCYKIVCTNKNKYISIRRNTFFSDMNLSLEVILKACKMWFNNRSQTDIILEMNVSKNFCIKLFKKLRTRIEKYFDENIYKLGGTGIICQIDESMFKYKQKYHVGRSSPSHRWVFGIADTSFKPAKYYVKVVPDRSSNTLLPIIADVCRQGTIIWSDEWRSYRNIENIGFNHLTVNHSLNFVNPINGCHTQHIESLWNKLKRRIKNLMGVKHDMLQSYLNEWIWKDNIAKNDINALYNLIK